MFSLNAMLTPTCVNYIDNSVHFQRYMNKILSIRFKNTKQTINQTPHYTNFTYHFVQIFYRREKSAENNVLLIVNVIGLIFLFCINVVQFIANATHDREVRKLLKSIQRNNPNQD